MPNAYSYLRFSTRRQAMGDSVRRQTEGRDRWLAAHPELGLTLVQDYRDLGVSAAKGQNRDTGELGNFLALVTAGKIPRGSYLLVENLDRISREELLDAVYLVLGILRAGVIIVSILDAVVYDRDDGETMLSRIMISLVILSRAGEESRTKSARGLANWERKRREAMTTGKRLSKMAPAWLDWDEQSRDFVFNAHAATVRRIFELSSAGCGSAHILRRLLAEGLPTLTAGKRTDGGKWSVAYIRQILGNRAVLGEFALATRRGDKRVLTGEVRADYYPVIVGAALWGAAQAALSSRQGLASKAVHRGAVNLFAGLCRCLECGGPMSMRTGVRPHLTYLRCLTRYTAKTCPGGRQYAYTPIETAVLDALASILLDEPADQSLAEIDAEIAQAVVIIERQEAGLRRLTRLVQSEASDPVIDTEFQASRQRLRTLRDHKLALDQNRRTAAGKRPAADEIERLDTLRRQMAEGPPEQRAQAKAALALAIRRIVTSVAFEADGTVIVEVAHGMRYLGVRAGVVAWSCGRSSLPDGPLAWIDCQDVADPGSMSGITGAITGKIARMVRPLSGEEIATMDRLQSRTQVAKTRWLAADTWTPLPAAIQHSIDFPELVQSMRRKLPAR